MVDLDVESFSWEDKWRLMDTLTKIHLESTAPYHYTAKGTDDLYIRNSNVRNYVLGHGETPECAINELFDKIFNLQDGAYISVNDTHNEIEMVYRWNGLGWGLLYSNNLREKNNGN